MRGTRGRAPGMGKAPRQQRAADSPGPGRPRLPTAHPEAGGPRRRRTRGYRGPSAVEFWGRQRLQAVSTVRGAAAYRARSPSGAEAALPGVLQGHAPTPKGHCHGLPPGNRRRPKPGAGRPARRPRTPRPGPSGAGRALAPSLAPPGGARRASGRTRTGDQASASEAGGSGRQPRGGTVGPRGLRAPVATRPAPAWPPRETWTRGRTTWVTGEVAAVCVRLPSQLRRGPGDPACGRGVCASRRPPSWVSTRPPGEEEEQWVSALCHPPAAECGRPGAGLGLAEPAGSRPAWSRGSVVPPSPGLWLSVLSEAA